MKCQPRQGLLDPMLGQRADPLLARMEKNGWLRSKAEGGAKERKNYRITPAGRKLLKQLRSEVEELYRELVLGEEPKHPYEKLP